MSLCRVRTSRTGTREELDNWSRRIRGFILSWGLARSCVHISPALSDLWLRDGDWVLPSMIGTDIAFLFGTHDCFRFSFSLLLPFFHLSYIYRYVCCTAGHDGEHRCEGVRRYLMCLAVATVPMHIFAREYMSGILTWLNNMPVVWFWRSGPRCRCGSGGQTG